MERLDSDGRRLISVGGSVNGLSAQVPGTVERTGCEPAPSPAEPFILLGKIITIYHADAKLFDPAKMWLRNP